eukprot:scaffold7801_cov363-Prasinococcus_capsulatus_cf.AAC.1
MFTITIHIKETNVAGEELIKVGKLNLVDLAGSENITRSGARDNRAREAGNINQSLLTLGRVISALVEQQSYVPYRDSKLTRMLRDSLGGKTKTCIIATVAPVAACLEETLSTLDYAYRAKNIKNKPEVNQRVTKTALIKDLNEEIDKLKSELFATREKNGVYLTVDRYEKEQKDAKAVRERCEELEGLLELKEKELQETKNLFEAEQVKLNELTDQHVETTKQLCETKDNLRQTEGALEEAK